jgi:hypothetical protein
MERVAVGILLVALAAPVVGEGAAPPWLRDGFAVRSVEVGADEVTIGLLEDGVGDLVAKRDGNGAVALQLRQPGTIVAAGRTSKGEAAHGAFAEFAALGAEEWLAFTFDVGGDGRPRPTVARARAVVGEAPLLLRTIRRCEDGGGALARVAARVGNEKGSVRLEFEVLALSPDLAPLPGAETRERPPAFASHGEALLFADESWGHPAWGRFDAVTLDRDHPSWRIGREAKPRLLAQRSQAPLDADVAERAFGFERALRVTSRAVDGAAPDDRAAPSLLAWRELKADALAPDGAVARHALVLLEANGEAAIGAWAVARDPARKSELHPALFSAQSDDDGRIALPVEAHAAAAAPLEVVAFVAGPRARFGRRLGVVAPTGGECVVLLDERATTTVKIQPPPGRPSWIGLHVAGGAFLLPLAADGVVKLPALGEEALLHLGAPYVEGGHRLLLAPDAKVTLEASLLPRS